ncbi:acyltransferase family protein [Bifidobacterium cebidarum]|uniref:Acyltransferase 3 n=1 Tax=Bifidobacterium cebidarum TaxID=2650773 RepID=A0A6I1GD27_9BIFI|nr:acyltransferase [Bifidobacterium cebidarum]KAB7786810.1 acyltransferase 3 [Bifidobacterium cebidarum]
MEQQHRKAAPGRITSLDGLRGVAALSVVCFHVSGIPAARNLFPGIPSVMMFFILSGVVLSVVPLTDPAYSWTKYYPRRVLRLGIPTAAATLLSVLVGIVVANTVGQNNPTYAGLRFSQDGNSPAQWLYTVLSQFDFIFNASDGVTTVGGSPSNRIDYPVWSMTWEFFFSLILPLVIVLALHITRDWLACVLVTTCIFVSFISGYFPLRFVTVFFFGMIIAKHLGTIRNRQRSFITVTGLLLLALLAIELPAIVGSFQDLAQHQLLNATTNTLMCLGGALLVITAAMPGWFSTFLSTRPIDYLGRISFSLYLTHFLCISAMRMITGKLGIAFSLAPMMIAVAGSIAFAAVFYALVERPSIRFAKRAANALLA